jgi:HEAT repeat protein
MARSNKAAEALGELGDKRAVPPLINAFVSGTLLNNSQIAHK